MEGKERGSCEVSSQQYFAVQPKLKYPAADAKPTALSRTSFLIFRSRQGRRAKTPTTTAHRNVKVCPKSRMELRMSTWKYWRFLLIRTVPFDNPLHNEAVANCNHRWVPTSISRSFRRRSRAMSCASCFAFAAGRCVKPNERHKALTCMCFERTR